ncbi:hypothetical protein FQN52_004178 [Onygenales sp. PD_12]|nr:hypothetical protein FQN52_004178 [Onygenales sp. PD_12]
MAPRNRKERRAAEATANFDPSSIPLARPPPNDSSSSSSSKAKTLYELAAERQTGLVGSKPPSGTEFVTVTPSGELSRFDPSNPSASPVTDSSSSPVPGGDTDATIPPLPDTILLSLPLSILHFTLSFLAAHQYAQNMPLKTLIQNTAFISFPVLTFLIHLSHGHIVSFNGFGRNKNKRPDTANSADDSSKFVSKFLWPPSAKSFLFLPMAVLLGAQLISMTNEASYYAVMKTAPSIGTLWVWSVLELSAMPALLGFLIPLSWGLLYKGYGIV